MVSLLVRLQRKLKALSFRKILLICALSVIVVNEYLVYTIQSLRWNKLPKRDPDEDMVILLVSDPQLIGFQDEQGFPVGMFARWDADRYLRNTFSRAFAHAKPDVILFLGDVMDEGSRATDQEYDNCFSRFRSIFYEATYTKTVVVPGDNDIGGEGGDFRTPYKVNRFEKHFESMTGVVSHGFIDFLKLDIRQHYDSLPEKQRLVTDMATELKAPIRIVVNHETMLAKFKSMIYPILRLSQPNLLLSGHWHISQMFTCDTCLSDNDDLHSWPYMLRQLEMERDYIDIDLMKTNAINEVMVPTCSYRMGVPFMGYGVAVINKSGSMKYSVIWLPSRYTVLRVYVYAFVIIAALFLIDFILTPLKTNASLFS